MTVIVILALVALFVGLRLYSVLGERTGHEQQPILKPADPDARVGISGLQYGLLLVAGALTENAVQAQPDEEGDECEDDDDGQSLNLV